jgi:hypothetical protein
LRKSRKYIELAATAHDLAQDLSFQIAHRATPHMPAIAHWNIGPTSTFCKSVRE